MSTPHFSRILCPWKSGPLDSCFCRASCNFWFGDRPALVYSARKSFLQVKKTFQESGGTRGILGLFFCTTRLSPRGHSFVIPVSTWGGTGSCRADTD